MRYFTGCLMLLTLSIAGLGATPEPAIAGPKAVNVIVDGDFSMAPNPGGFATYPKGSTAITGWTVTQATVDLIGTYWTAPGGARSVDLDGTPGTGAIAQSFKTVRGAKYVVSFLLSGNGECPPDIKRARVTVAGTIADFAVDTNKASIHKNIWAAKTVAFTATRAMTTLQFASKDPPGGQCGPVVAAIKVVRRS